MADRPADRPAPPPEEQALGLRSYLTATPGIGGRLRHDPEDFFVVELGDGPAPFGEGAFTAVRVRLRNWETNRFVGQAARALGIPREHVAFAGMKDKRAVTEQWFTVKAPPAALAQTPDRYADQDRRAACRHDLHRVAASASSASAVPRRCGRASSSTRGRSWRIRTRRLPRPPSANSATPSRNTSASPGGSTVSRSPAGACALR